MMPNNSLTPGTPLQLQNAATTGNGQILRLRGCTQNLTIVLQSTDTTSGGAVQIEEAYFRDDENAYSGTWSPLGSAINASSFTGGAQQHVHIQNYSIWALRVRISSDITGGGSISVWAWAT